MKRALGAIAIVGLAVALGIYLPNRSQRSGSAATQAIFNPEENSPLSTAKNLSDESLVGSGLPPTASTHQKPSVQVQTSSDVFALYSELKSAQFGSSKETAEARYAAMMAIDQCSKYTRPEIYKGTLDKIESLPASDPNKALRLQAYRFDMDRCRGFQGWGIDRIVAETSDLLAEAAKLGSPAARMKVAAARYFNEGGMKKPEVKEAVLRELTQIVPDGDGAVLNAAADFIAYFQHSYSYVSEQNGDTYTARMIAIALNSIACEQGGLCPARHGGTNTVDCWAGNECAALPPDEYIQREALPPAQYERFLVLRQELLANLSAGRWPAGFWTNAHYPSVNIGTAVNK